MNHTISSLTNETDVCDRPNAEAEFNETLKVLGDFWILRILCSLDERSQRFCELERSLQNSNPVTLTKKLKVLEENGFVYRQAEIDDKQSVSYMLTEKGRATLPIITAVRQFSTDHS